MARDLSRGDHLPNLRPDGQPPHPSWLPRQRRGTTPQMIGRYPDFDVYDAVDTWDDATAAVIEGRMAVTDGGFRFFGPAEVPTVRALCDICVAQDNEPKVLVPEMIDEKLAAGRLDYGPANFSSAAAETQEAIVGQLADARLSGGSWDRLNVKRAWCACA